MSRNTTGVVIILSHISMELISHCFFLLPVFIVWRWFSLHAGLLYRVEKQSTQKWDGILSFSYHQNFSSYHLINQQNLLNNGKGQLSPVNCIDERYMWLLIWKKLVNISGDRQTETDRQTDRQTETDKQQASKTKRDRERNRDRESSIQIQTKKERWLLSTATGISSHYIT